MSANTKIEWADHTFNPWIGCTKVSPGCDHCYAEASFDKHRKVVKWGAGQPRKHTAPSTWEHPGRWNAEAERLGVRYRVFCASLADVFDNEVPAEWRQELFELIAKTPNLDWLLLTKRIGNARAMLNQVIDTMSHGLNTWDELPWPGVWIGATVCNQAEADRDIPKLLAVPAAKHFLSMEPLLGCVYIEDIPDPTGGVCLKPLAGLQWVGNGEGRCTARSLGSRIDWVIVGGESGPNARPMHPDWARSLRDQCAAAGVPFLFKQWGEWVPRGPESMGYPIVDGVPRVRLTDEGECGSVLGAKGGNDCWMQRAGKIAAGRLLDGAQHDERPIASDVKQALR